MAINKKLIHFNKGADFDKALLNKEILDTSICWIKDRQQIYTHQWGLQGVPDGGQPDLILTIDDNGNLIWSDPVYYTKEETDNKLVEKADIDLLSNILGSEVVDGQTFPDIHSLTRDELKKDLFDDMWKAAFGEWGDVDHTHMENGKPAPYYGNELWMTYEEALAVDYVSKSNALYSGENAFGSRFGLGVKFKPRTLYPLMFHGGQNNATLNGAFQSAQSLEKIRFTYDSNGSFVSNQMVTSLRYGFFNCTKLTHVLGIINLSTSFNSTGFESAFYNCHKLQEIRLKRLPISVSFSYCAFLSKESLEYMITEATNTSPITITLHADIYNKIIEGEGEWEGILDLAISKNISIAKA